jgi:protein-disulfide isomerase
MHRAVAKDGKLRVVYKDWPIFGIQSERAAATALASASQNIYPQVHDRLMTGPAETEEDLKLAIRQSGGDWRRLRRDMAHGKLRIHSQLTRNSRQAFELGLQGTPGYLVGPILVRGVLTEREFLRVFEDARKARRGF